MYTPIIKDKKFVTYDEKPVFCADYRAISNNLKNPYSLTIMMQGPLKSEDDFTIETLKLYKQTFPNCPIILSTWKTEDPRAIKKIRALGVDVLLNDAPETKGLFNINYQILSTQNGLKYAKEKGAEYVIKTRTDQRFYETNIPQFLFNLLKVFPVYDANVQKARLITLSFDTFKYRLYDVSDMFLFGHIDDVIKFWSCDFEKRTKTPKWKNMLDYCKLKFSEIYYTTEYLEKLGYKIDWTLKNSWQAYARYFCIVDAHSLGLYWPKYYNFVNRWRNFLGINPQLEELTFKEWFNLYTDLDNIEAKNGDEWLLNGFKLKPSILMNEAIFEKKPPFYVKAAKKIAKFLYRKKVGDGKVTIKICKIQVWKKKI